MRTIFGWVSKRLFRVSRFKSSCADASKTNRFRHKLQRNKPIQPVIVGQPDNAHPAAAENFLKGKPTEKLAAAYDAAHRLTEIGLVVIGGPFVHVTNGKSRGCASRIPGTPSA